MDGLTEEARRARNEYAKQWRHKNKDKVDSYNKKYWEKKAAAAAEAGNNGKA